MKTRILLALAITLPFISCAGSSVRETPVAVSADRTIEGIWEDTETGSRHVIVREGNTLRVVSIVTTGYDQTGEVMEIRSSREHDGVLSWTYYVPSTGYTVSFETVSCAENRLKVKWTNNDGKGAVLNGVETLIRVVDGKRTEEPDAAEEEYHDTADTPDDNGLLTPENDNSREDEYKYAPEDENTPAGE